MIAPAYSSLPDRFWAKVRPTGDCWVWVGAQTSRGYGSFSHEGRAQSTHRLTWIDAHGAIPDNMTVDHLCRVRSCVNPAHMEIVTAVENFRRSREMITHCPVGHEYTPENTRVNSRGYRSCLECGPRHSRDYRARRLDAAAS